MWYVLQIVVFIAVVWYLRALGDTISLPAAPLWIVGAAAALWVTAVINSITRARELRREGRGWLRKWGKEVWAAEAMLPPGTVLRSDREPPSRPVASRARRADIALAV